MPPGAVILPPDTTLLLQVLLTMFTLAGATLKVGQVEQAVGTVVPLTTGPEQLVVVLRHRTYTVIAEVV